MSFQTYVKRHSRDAELSEHIKTIREAVFERDDYRCRLCLWHRADSMHELQFASLVGDRLKATTLENCLAVCGGGTTGCHGLLQANIVVPIRNGADPDVDGQKFDANKMRGAGRLSFVLRAGYDRRADVVSLWHRLHLAAQFIGDGFDIDQHIQKIENLQNH
jgi:hypothetical protein